MRVTVRVSLVRKNLDLAASLENRHEVPGKEDRGCPLCFKTCLNTAKEECIMQKNRSENRLAFWAANGFRKGHRYAIL